jgi:hypothetical protein
MILNTAVKTVAPLVPVVSSAYGFGRTCIRVYNATSLTKALIAGVKRIVIDSTPPVVKYPLLCAGAAGCGVAAFCTGDPNFAIGAFECLSAIVE